MQRKFEYKGCTVFIDDDIRNTNEKYANVDVKNFEYDEVYISDMGGFDLLEYELEKDTAENMAKNYIDYIDGVYGIEYFLSIAFDEEKDPLMSDGIPWEEIRVPREEYKENEEKLIKGERAWLQEQNA